MSQTWFKEAVALAEKTWDQTVDRARLPRFVRQRLEFGDDERDAPTLDLVAYRQTQFYTCGFTAGLSVLHTFYPRRSANAFFRRVAPDLEEGTPDARLIRALRQSGIGVGIRKSLDFASIAESIEGGRPIITTVKRGESVAHWVVIYGVRRRPSRSVFLAGDGFFDLAKNEIPWGQFRLKMWSPVGEGLVCWGKV